MMYIIAMIVMLIGSLVMSFTNHYYLGLIIILIAIACLLAMLLYYPIKNFILSLFKK